MSTDEMLLHGSNDTADEELEMLLSKRPAVARDAQLAAARRVVKQAQVSRLPPPPLTVEPARGEIGEIVEDDILGAILGIVEDVEDDGPGTFTPAESPDFPITHDLYRRYKAAMPAPKLVRVDTEDSYATFIEQKRAPYQAALAEHMHALEAASATHHAEGGDGLSVRPEDIEALGEAARKAADQAQYGGTKVPLSLPPWAKDKVSCWQDGTEIFCSVMLAAEDGSTRVVTTATPAERHVDEALTYASDADVDPVEIMGVLPVLAQVLGGGSLVTQISRAAPVLLARPEVVSGKVFIGKVTPACDPAVAAVMSLLQRCKNGDQTSCSEADRLKSAKGGTLLVRKAVRALAMATDEVNDSQKAAI